MVRGQHSQPAVHPAVAGTSTGSGRVCLDRPLYCRRFRLTKEIHRASKYNGSVTESSGFGRGNGELMLHPPLCGADASRRFVWIYLQPVRSICWRAGGEAFVLHGMKRKIVDFYGLETHVIGENGEPSNEDFRVAFCNLNLTIKDGIPTNIPSLDYLFIGSIGSAYHRQHLLDAGITHIVCLSDIIRLAFPDTFQYLRVPMVDQVDYNLRPDLQCIFDFVRAAREQGGRTLIHCYQGKSRSVTVCCAYLIRYYNHTVESSLDLIRSVRPMASPNSGFMHILQDYEKDCKAAAPEQLQA